MSINPHGGTLVDRRLNAEQAQHLLGQLTDARRITVSNRVLSDIYMIAIGGFSPLRGFMNQADYESVVENMHLTSGEAFSIPINLPVSQEEYNAAGEGEKIVLVDDNGKEQAVITVSGKYERNMENEAQKVYGTTEDAHPGVAKMYEHGPYTLAGDIDFVNLTPELDFPEHNLTPAQTRALFAERGWETVVAFQTRNPIHRAHEYIIKCALEIVDGLLIHPLVGETKADDIPADVRMDCYHILMDKYFPDNRVALSVLPAAMRYAGPREAIFHAIMRKNYGCTHFIVGRDHAGVGNYYGTYDAQKIFDKIDLEKFELKPLMFEHSFWCKLTGGMATAKTSPSSPDQRIFLSGTKVREMLKNGEMPPVEFSRPEVAQRLIDWATQS